MKKFILLLIICVWPLTAFAETTIKAEVDKQSLSSDDTLTYKISIISDGRNVPMPEFPNFKDFSVLSRIQSTSINFSEGKMKNSAVFAFVLYPLKTGELEIKPGTIKVDGKTLSSESFKIQVKQGKTVPEEKSKAKPKKAMPQEKPALPEESTSQEEQVTL